MAIEFKKGISVDGNSSITGTVSISSVTSDNSTYTGIMVWDGGVLKYRTKSQILSDIGATSNTGTVTSVTVQGTTGLSGSGTVTTSGTITLTNSDRGSSQAIYKNIATQSGTATANSNNDTLTITGTGGTTTSRSGDTITINSTDNNDNYYVSSVSFNTGNGVLTLNRHNTTTLTVDLDGRYVTSSGVTSVATTNGITGGTITSTGTIQLDSTVVRTTGDQSVGGIKTFTTDVFIAGDTKDLVISNTAETQAGIVFTDAQAGTGQAAAIKFDCSTETLDFFVNDETAERMSINTSGVLTLVSGSIVLSGTGRIQGIDSVTASTDAANKAYVDTAVAGVPQGTVTSIKATTDGNSLGLSGAVTSTGTLTLPWQGSTSQYVRGDGSLSAFPALSLIHI